MSVATVPSSTRPLACLKQILRQCHAERQQRRRYATTQTEPKYPSLQHKYPLPSPGFHPSHATRQNRYDSGKKTIPVIPPPRSTAKICPDPLRQVFESQLPVLDPTGARTRLFSPTNIERAKVGDILMVRLKSGDPFSGVILSIRRGHSPVDAAVLLRNTVTRVGVEMWYKIYSPNVEGMEIVQRRQKRARRARLYYMRQPKHDAGSVENIVKAYLRTRSSSGARSSASRGRDASSKRKGNSQKGKN